MEPLYLLLARYGSGGEALFAGALIGIASSLILSLIEFIFGRKDR